MFRRLREVHVPRALHWWEKHEHWVTGAALVTGFIFDLWIAKRPDSLIDNLLLLNYLCIAGVLIVILNLRPKRSGEQGPVEPLPLLFALQFCFGGLSSNLLVLYGRSGTFAGTALFILLLVGMFIGNEAFRNKYAQMRFHIAAYYLLLFTYLIISIPTFIVHQVGTWVFLLSGITSLAVMLPFLLVLRLAVRQGKKEKKTLWEARIIIFIIFVAFNLFYFFNIIPPVPLSLKDIGIYHAVAHTDSGDYTVTYEAPAWFVFWRDTSDTYTSVAGAPAYCFSSVFAPNGLATAIVHKWESYDLASKSWEARGEVSFPISGGRAGGYRGFSVVAVTPGQWRCDVETQNGTLIGRISFNVAQGAQTPTLSTNTL